MPSHTSSHRRRVPQRPRGEQRVAELLDAAAGLIAEVGFEGATMSAIAERAGASIGALYQYFPNKDAVARALRAQYGDEMDARWTPLAHEEASLDTAHLVNRIVDVVAEFIAHRPAFLHLLGAPVSYARDPASRIRLREHFAALFRRRRPALTAADAFRVANVTLQVVKSMGPLYSEAKGRERQEIVEEFKAVLCAYLTARLE